MATDSMTLVRVLHHAGAELREFALAADPSNEQREEFLLFLGFEDRSHFGRFKMVAARDLLETVLCATNTKLGGWCEIRRGGKVVAAHPRARAREAGAEWVGNLGAGGAKEK